MATITQTATISIPRGAVTAELNFYQAPEDGSAPTSRSDPRTSTLPVKNYGMTPHPIEISDVRGHESEFTLDKNAFQVLLGIKSEMQAKDFDDDEHIKRVYLPEVEKLLLEHVPGANRVHIFDYQLRRKPPGSLQGPVMHVHCDVTTKFAIDRLRLSLADDAEKLLQGRYRIINVWCPINGPVYAYPLAFANSPTVVDEDLVPVKLLLPERTGEFFGVKYNAKQEWHHLSGITNEERVLLKTYDSDEKVGKWGRVPHCAFNDPRTPAEAPHRESIEVRAFVFG